MRAFQLTALGLDKLTLTELPEPSAGPGQVLVRLNAWSLNYRDLMIATGTYHVPSVFPLIPLSDGAGEVIAVGEGVSSVRPGERVMSSFFSNWVDGTLTPERAQSALGATDVPGMLAELVALPAHGVVRTPDHLSDAEAATLPCAALTAWHALYEGEDPLKPGQVVLLEGTGGVSIFGLQLAKLGGAQVIITSSNDEKLRKAIDLGADQTINYQQLPDWHGKVRELAQNAGVDHVLEVGGKSTLGQALNALRHGGQLHLIGGLSGQASDLPLLPMAMNAARVRRIYVGSVAMFEAMNRAVSAHRLRPAIDRSFPFTQARAALEYLKSGLHFGKVVITR